MDRIAVFLLLIFLLMGCGKEKDSFTVEIGPPDPPTPGLGAPSWDDIGVNIPQIVGGKQLDASFRGLSFSDNVVATAQYSQDDELNDICRIGLYEQKLYGACLNPSEEVSSGIMCFVGKIFLGEADRTDTSCEDVYGVFSEEETFSCAEGTLDEQKVLRCTDGIVVFSYEYKTLCRVHTLTNTGRCVDSSGDIGHFQKTTWKGYGREVVLTGETLSPVDIRQGSSSSILRYRTSSTGICSINDGSENSQDNGQVSGLATGDCDIELTVSAPRYVDKVFKITLNVEVDTRPSFEQHASIANVGSIVGESVGTVTLPKANGGNGKLTYTITPSLPRGIVFDLATRELSGTSQDAFSQVRYMYTVTDADGDIDEIRFSITVSKGQQEFAWPTNAYGVDASLAVGQDIYLTRFITGGRGNLEYRPSEDSASICTVSTDGIIVAGKAIGECIIQVRWTGDDNWLASAWHDLLVTTVAKGTQEFRWPSNPYGSRPSLAIGDSLALSNPIQGGEGTLSFQARGASNCTVTQEGVVESSAAGVCIVEARWLGDSNWEATSWRELLNIPVGSKEAQSGISWPPHPYGTDPSLNVDQTLSLVNVPTGGTGNLEYQSLNQAVCTVSGRGGVAGVSVGSCQINVRWTGNSNQAPTPWHSLLTSFQVGKGTQSYRWPSRPYGSNNPSLAVGGELRLSLINEGHGSLVFRVGGVSGCLADTTDGTVRSDHVGKCVVEARWAGNANYEASDWHELLNIDDVSQGRQTFLWPLNPYGTDLSLSVEGSQGILSLPVDAITGGVGELTFQSQTTSTCTVDTGGHVTGKALGRCTIEAKWAGNADWLATDWQRILNISVEKDLGTIVWGSYDGATIGRVSARTPITLPARAEDNYVRNSGSCSVDVATGTATALDEATLEDCFVTVTVTRSGYASQSHEYTVTISRQ